MTKLDIEKLSTIYEQISYGAPGGADKYGPTMGRGGYGTRPVPEDKPTGDTIDSDKYNDGYSVELDNEKSPFKYATFKSLPIAIKARTALFQETESESIDSVRFWMLFTSMYGLPLWSAEINFLSPAVILYAAQKVNQDFPSISLRADPTDNNGRGSITQGEKFN